MLFNSLDFLVFLPVVLIAYWSIRTVRMQNVLLLLASYVFYGWWDPKFLGLIIFSSVVDFFCGLSIAGTSDPRRKDLWTGLSIAVNLGLLGTFKYFDFFAHELTRMLATVGMEVDMVTLDLVLPVGISFYTFQTLSYTLDVRKGRIRPTRDLLSFMTFVAFFPQLVAGPIERASSLLPQIQTPRRFKSQQVISGIELVIWGFFKKLVVADNCAWYVDQVFDAAGDPVIHGSTLIIGAVLFAFQIYGDFSGYSDIAIGVARMLGVDLMTNFNYPYFSRNIGEFWRRWHISLSTWFRDYVYIPLGGSRGGRSKALRNIMIVFVVSGLWHGANKTFLAWGTYHGLLFIPLFLLGRNRTDMGHLGDGPPSRVVLDLFRVMLTFLLVCLGWVLFRAENLRAALIYFRGLASNYGDAHIMLPRSLEGLNHPTLPTLTTLIVLSLILEWGNRRTSEPLAVRLPFGAHHLLKVVVVMAILFYGEFGATEFIYFQF